MQAIWLRSCGAPEVLEAAQVELPALRPDHVRLRVEAVGVNYYDTLVRSGAVTRAIPLPHVVGSDVVGRVERCGAGVRDFAPVQRVLVAPGWPADPAEWNASPENEAPSYFPTGTYGWGGYAEQMDVPARW